MSNEQGESPIVNQERLLQELGMIIGREARAYVEQRGSQWAFSTKKDKWEKETMTASFKLGSWFVNVRGYELDLYEQVPGVKLAGVYQRGKPLPLSDEYVYPEKTGVEISFGTLNPDVPVDRGSKFKHVNEKLTEGVVDFLRELENFIALVENNVFLFPTDDRRFNLYEKFFRSSKFDEHFKGKYYLFELTS